MSARFLDDEDFFEFDLPELETDNYFGFKAKFKIIDTQNGYKIMIDKIYKRSLTKLNLDILQNLIETKFPVDINEVSGLELEEIRINKFYSGEFEVSIYTSGVFDLTVVSFE